ncbi:MAG: hypothetical protein ACFFB5_14080 [Promethearchaeota archaeon]
MSKGYIIFQALEILWFSAAIPGPSWVTMISCGNARLSHDPKLYLY